MEDGKIIVKDYLKFLDSSEVKNGVKEFQKQQAEGVKRAPRL
jgi:hypothetical protein